MRYKPFGLKKKGKKKILYPDQPSPKRLRAGRRGSISSTQDFLSWGRENLKGFATLKGLRNQIGN
jgi:hypothetical protein